MPPPPPSFFPSFRWPNHVVLPLLAVLVCGSGAGAQEANPSERYAEAHKQYADARCPIEADDITHFVYFARDRQAIRDHAFLENARFAGAQIMYPWFLLEPEEGRYDFSLIEADLEYLKSKGKTLFIQLQDATFDPDLRSTPEYLHSDKFDSGSILQRTDDGVPEGWVAKRWNRQVRERFSLLLSALGEAFDGRIEGINLQETAIGVTAAFDDSFSPRVYVESIKANMRALKNAFPRSVTMQYANFMPGEWLPWENEGYLKSIYEYGEEIGVGLGAPDLMIQRKGQLNHALAMMHEGEYAVPLGVAVQDGNYIGQTGADFPPGSEREAAVGLGVGERRNIVPVLHAFAKDFLKVRYLFWVDQEPYFNEQVLPCFAGD